MATGYICERAEPPYTIDLGLLTDDRASQAYRLTHISVAVVAGDMNGGFAHLALREPAEIARGQSSASQSVQFRSGTGAIFQQQRSARNLPNSLGSPLGISM